jgi:predicted nucleic acid-binding protein
MGGVVCIDTHVLIWGIKRDSSPSQKFMIGRTVNFLEWLQNKQNQVIVPAPVLGEFLMRVPTEKHQVITSEIQSKFMVLPFDANAASLFAQVWQKNKNNGLPAEDSTREKMKTDSMIVAIAVANKASILYSEDPGLKKFAEGFINISNIPSIHRQLRLDETNKR